MILRQGNPGTSSDSYYLLKQEHNTNKEEFEQLMQLGCASTNY